MKLLFKQRVFSWLDSYDIYNEQEEVVFRVKGQLSWGHKLLIYNKNEEQVGEIVEQVLSWLPKFHVFEQGEEVGMIEKELTFLKPKFHITCSDWEVSGDFWEWEYEVNSQSEGHIMHASKELFQWADTYIVDIENERNALRCLMVVLAIDAAKCSQGN